jgi:hypothetical protein
MYDIANYRQIFQNKVFLYCFIGTFPSKTQEKKNFSEKFDGNSYCNRPANFSK